MATSFPVRTASAAPTPQDLTRETTIDTCLSVYDRAYISALSSGTDRMQGDCPVIIPEACLIQWALHQLEAYKAVPAVKDTYESLASYGIEYDKAMEAREPSPVYSDRKLKSLMVKITLANGYLQC